MSTLHHHSRPGIRTLTAGSLSLGLLVLTACGGGAVAEDEETSADADYGSIDVPLSWLHTAEFVGLYEAIDNGYYEENGFESVNLIPAAPPRHLPPCRWPLVRVWWAGPTRWWLRPRSRRRAMMHR